MMASALLAMSSAAQSSGVTGGGGRARAERGRPRHPQCRPVVVELFTAQGCGGCIEANTAVERAASEPGVIALTYGVDYWDYLGWTRHLRPAPSFLSASRAYRAALRQRGVSTPQVVIDGRRQVSGAHGLELEGAIVEETGRQSWPPQIRVRETGDRVGVGSGRAPSAGPMSSPSPIRLGSRRWRSRAARTAAAKSVTSMSCARCAGWANGAAVRSSTPCPRRAEAMRSRC